jgi:uncharacterized protein involved in exopolysaccharide biosynthesis/Mrp family chromosome partitioning ATPase
MFAYDQPMRLRPRTVKERPRANSASLSLFDLAGLLYRQKTLIIAAALACACASVIIGKSLSPRYSATAELYVDPRELQLVERDLTPQTQDLTGLSMIVESEARLMASNQVLLKVIENLKLDQDLEFGGASGYSIGSLFGVAGKSTDDNAIALDALSRHVSVKRTDRTFIIDVDAWSYDSAKAALLANAVAAAYLQESTQSQAAAARRATAELSGRLNDLKERLRTAENNLATYKANNNFVGTQDTQISDQQLALATQRLANAQAAALEAQTKFDQIEAGRQAAGAIPEALQSPTIANLRAQYAEARRRQADAVSELGPLHPAVRTVEKQVDDLRRSINEEVERFADSAKAELVRAQGYEASLAKALGAQKQRSVQLGQASVQLRELEHEVEASRSVYQAFLKRSMETQEQERLNTSSARIIGDATPPRRRIFPPPISLLAALGFALGAIAASAWAVLDGRTSRAPQGKSEPIPARRPIAQEAKPQLDGPVFSAKPLIVRLQEDDVFRTSNTDFPRHGAIELASLGLPVLRPDPSVGPFVDSVRRLAAAAIERSTNGRTPTICVTDLGRNNGRPAVSLNVALALAREGAKVLLIDADRAGHQLSDRALEVQATGQGSRNRLMPRRGFEIIETADDVAIQRIDADSDHEAVYRGLMGAQSSGRYDFILLDGPTLPARKRDRRLLNRQPALLLVLPLNLRINERMEAALAALGPASSNLIGVILNEAVDA